MGVPYLNLSPGEIERHEREAAQQLRCERLQQVRQRAGSLSRAACKSNLVRRKHEENELHASEIQALIEAKRARLEGLLSERATCEKLNGTASRAAASRSRERSLEEDKLVSMKAHQNQLELRRSSHALQHMRAPRLAEDRSLRERLSRQCQVRDVEDQRARLASTLCRELAAAAAAEKDKRDLCASQAQRQELQVHRVPRADVRGIADFSRTCYHISHHGNGIEAFTIEAERARPMSPAPTPTPEQLSLADARGQAAEAELAAERFDRGIEMRLAEESARDRRDKVRRVASAGAPVRTGKASFLRWGADLPSASVEAAAEVKDILAEIPIAGARAGTEEWTRDDVDPMMKTPSRGSARARVASVGKPSSGRTTGASQALVHDTATPPKVIAESRRPKSAGTFRAISPPQQKKTPTSSVIAKGGRSVAVHARIPSHMGLASSHGDPALHPEAEYCAEADASFDRSCGSSPAPQVWYSADDNSGQAEGVAPPAVSLLLPGFSLWPLPEPSPGTALQPPPLLLAAQVATPPPPPLVVPHQTSSFRPASPSTLLPFSGAGFDGASNCKVVYDDCSLPHTAVAIESQPTFSNGPPAGAAPVTDLLSDAEALLQETVAAALPIAAGEPVVLAREPISLSREAEGTSEFSRREANSLYMMQDRGASPQLSDRRPIQGGGLSSGPTHSRRWDAEDLGARLEEICRELDDVVGGIGLGNGSGSGV